MMYEVINPSDAVFLEHNDDLEAAMAAMILGEGKYGLEDADGKTVLPICLFPGQATEWMEGHGIDLGAYLNANSAVLASCLESAIYGPLPKDEPVLLALRANPEALAEHNDKGRSSMNDIVHRAQSLAHAFRQKAEEGDPCEP